MCGSFRKGARFRYYVIRSYGGILHEDRVAKGGNVAAGNGANSAAVKTMSGRSVFAPPMRCLSQITVMAIAMGIFLHALGICAESAFPFGLLLRQRLRLAFAFEFPNQPRELVVLCIEVGQRKFESLCQFLLDMQVGLVDAFLVAVDAGAGNELI